MEHSANPGQYLAAPVRIRRRVPVRAPAAAASGSMFRRVLPWIVRDGVIGLCLAAVNAKLPFPFFIWLPLAILCMVILVSRLKKDPAEALAFLIVISCSASYDAIPAVSLGGTPFTVLDVMILYLIIRMITRRQDVHDNERLIFGLLLGVMLYATIVGLFLGNDKAMTFRNLRNVLPFVVIPLSIRITCRDSHFLRLESAVIATGFLAALRELYLFVSMRSLADLGKLRAGTYEYIFPLAAAFLLHWQLNRKMIHKPLGHALAIGCQCMFVAATFVCQTRSALIFHAAILFFIFSVSSTAPGKKKVWVAGLAILTVSVLLAIQLATANVSQKVGSAVARVETLSDPMKKGDTLALRVRTASEAMSETLSSSPLLGLGFGRILEDWGTIYTGVTKNVEIAPAWWYWTTGAIGFCIWLLYSILTPLRRIVHSKKIRNPDYRFTARIWAWAFALFVLATSVSGLITVESGILLGSFFCINWHSSRSISSSAHSAPIGKLHTPESSS
jgi:hypothetical protein